MSHGVTPLAQSRGQMGFWASREAGPLHRFDSPEALGVGWREQPLAVAAGAALAAHDAEQVAPFWPSQISLPIDTDKDLTRSHAPEDDYISWSN